MSVTNSLTAVGSPPSFAPRSPAPRARSTAPGPVLTGSWLATQGRLPLAFMGLGLVWLAIATALLVGHSDLLALPHFVPPVVALTHAWVLGVFVTVACGAVYQLAPVALGTTLWSERGAWWHLALHAVGVPGMVYCLWTWNLPGLGVFGLAVALGIAGFAVNTWGTVQRSGRRDAVAWSLALAAGWLLATASAGLLLAANHRWGFLRADPLALLRAHAHLGLVGFFVTLLQGVTFRLVPMFTLGEVRDWRPVNAGLGLSQVGLLGLVPGLALQLGSVTAVATLLLLAGFACSAAAMVQTLRHRRKRAFDPGLKAFLRGLAVLGAAALAGALLAWPGRPASLAPGGFGPMDYALLVLAGGLLPAIAGMMCKVVPFLTWMRAYGPEVGRVPTPPATALTHPRIETWGLGLQGLALVPLLAGAWLLNEPLLRLGACLLAAGVGLFLADMLGVLRHLVRPVTAGPVGAKGGSA